MRASIVKARLGSRLNASPSLSPSSSLVSSSSSCRIHHRAMSMVPKKNDNQNQNNASTNTNTNTNNNTNNNTVSNNNNVYIPDQVMSAASSASSYLNNIRFKIATSLTSSMNEQEKLDLFSTLNVTNDDNTNDNNDDNKVKTKEVETPEPEQTQPQKIMPSIGEAVAEALAKEASKNKQMMEKHKVKIFQQAEKAALERIQNDLLIRERKVALEKWEKELRDEKLNDEKMKLAQLEEDVDVDVELDADEVAVEDHQNEHEHEHPVLGKVIMNLGYKRIHIMSANKLASIPIWEKQRVYRHDRAKSMAKDKLKTMELGLPGVVALHETLDGELSIIDGQHRVGMLAILESRKSVTNGNDHSNGNDGSNDDNCDNDGNNTLNLDQILVEVFPQTSSSPPSHAQDIFIEINKAEPVKLVDMPGMAKKGDIKIINDIASQLNDSYPDMFKPSQRCRSPHLNIDNLRDAIFASGLLKRHGIKSKTALNKWIMERNDEMRVKFHGSGSSGSSGGSGVGKVALEKAKKFDFYLGLDMSWLHL